MAFANAQEARDYKRRWRAANREKVNAQALRWQHENQDKVLAYRNSPRYQELKRNAGKVWWLTMTPDQVKRQVFSRAKKRAQLKGLEFTITMNDLVWPVFCPVLGIELDYSPMGRAIAENKKKNPAVPSIDRTDNARGYVPGNVAVISWRANSIKRDSTIEELKRLIAYLAITGEK